VRDWSGGAARQFHKRTVMVLERAGRRGREGIGGYGRVPLACSVFDEKTMGSGVGVVQRERGKAELRMPPR
jgi:hypothetical protein